MNCPECLDDIWVCDSCGLAFDGEPAHVSQGQLYCAVCADWCYDSDDVVGLHGEEEEGTDDVG